MWAARVYCSTAVCGCGKLAVHIKAQAWLSTRALHSTWQQCGGVLEQALAHCCALGCTALAWHTKTIFDHRPWVDSG